MKILSIISLFFFLFILNASAQNLQITSISPGINQHNVNIDANIVVDFDQSINGDFANDTTIIVRGSQSGKINGMFSGGGTSTIIFNPSIDFRLGEIVSITLTTAIISDGGMNLTRGHTYSFTVISGAPPANPIAFAQRDIAGAGSGGREIKVFDYDADGDLDLISSSEGLPEQIYVLENDGVMGFCAYSTGGNFRNVEVYDIDGDGDYDNFGATGAFDTELNWFENEGSPPFTEHLISVDDPWTLAGGDLDSDGDIDVVAGVLRISPVSHHLLWFTNDGTGNFSSNAEIPSTFTGGSDSYFYIRDINSDGAMDILAFHREAYNLVWYENNGSQSFTEHVIFNTSDRMRLASGDIDGDGDIDIVTVSVENGPTAPISWWENDGSENFTEHPISATTTGRLYNVNIADVDGDLDIDILSGGYWFENDGNENFSEVSIGEGLKLGNNYFANGINYADMDEDGDMDIVTLGLYSTSWQENSQFMEIVSTSPVNAAGSVAPNANINISFDQPIDIITVNNHIRVFSQYNGLIVGTLSGGGSNTITFDPIDDFISGDMVEVSVNEKVLSTTGYSLATTYGFSFQVQTAAVIQPVFFIHHIKSDTNNVSGMDIADIDGDGDLDLVSCSFSELHWHENDGNGNFTSIPITTTALPVGVVAFDENGDGFMDILVDNNGFNPSMIYTNDGNQNFSESPFIGSQNLKQITDVNHDGDTDIISLSQVDDWLSWSDSRCGGYGGYGYMPRLGNKDVQAADMDNDGDIDFIAASFLGPIYYQNNDYFIYADLYFDNNRTSQVYLSDLDGDGDLDPIFTEDFSAIIWYENRLTEDSLDFGGKQEIAPLNQDPRDVIAVDIDGDGDSDIAAVSRNDDKVVWYENRLNEPSMNFGPEQIGVTTADGPIKILAGDLDGDGDMDLVTISDRDDELNWFQNSGNATGINDKDKIVPLSFRLEQNYPNPFNPVTTIRYELAEPSRVKLELFNSLGQQVGLLINEDKVVGNHSIEFKADNIPSGVYYYKIKTSKFTQIKKMILLK